jgi:hypothetical protein
MPIYLSGPRVLTYGELPLKPAAGVNLRCPDCRTAFVPYRAHYAACGFDWRGSVLCPDCDLPLELVRARTVYDVISPEEAEAK